MTLSHRIAAAIVDELLVPTAAVPRQHVETRLAAIVERKIREATGVK